MGKKDIEMPHRYMPDSARRDVGAVHRDTHSRWRVYPQNVTVTVALPTVAVANTFGAWTQIIPLATVTMPFHIIGIVIEAADKATTYFVQLGYNTVLADPPANYELGERRFVVPTPIVKATEVLELHSQGLPAGARVMGRVKSTSGAIDTVDVSLVLSRHLVVSMESPLWPNYPW